MSATFDRRDFLRAATATGLGLGMGVERLAGQSRAAAYPAAATPFAAPPMSTIRVGFVGVGHRGPAHLRNFLKQDGVQVRAICDLVPERVARAQETVVAAGQPKPAAYGRDENDYRRMYDREELDLVIISTPWEWHARMCRDAMERDKHAFTELPMAMTVEDCWMLVETAQRTRRHCVLMENTNYDRTELMILNMVRQKLFGELLHAECGYLHDLRQQKLTDFYGPPLRWRGKHSIQQDGDLYPMHGIGPVAWWMDINRGNQFDHLVSMSTKSRGLELWAAEHIGPNSPEAKQEYAHGDVVNTLIRTQAEQTILITHNTDSPRPYSRKVLLQGTSGLVRKYPEEKIHIEGKSKEHQWQALEEYRAQYDHPLWTALEEKARGGGHGGMDYIMAHRLVKALREGTPTDYDVYDGAAWSAIIDLSRQSIAARSGALDFPDFTRGAWKSRPALPELTA